MMTSGLEAKSPVQENQRDTISLPSQEDVRESSQISQAEYDQFLMQNAIVLIENKNFELAQNLLTDVLSRDPYHRVAIRYLGESFLALKDFENAVRCFQSLVKVGDAAHGFFGIGQYYYEKAQFESARTAYMEALQHLGDENSEDLHFDLFKQLGNVFVREGDYDAAEENYNKAFAIRPHSDILLVNYGTLEIQRGDLDKALSRFGQAIECNQSSDRAWLGVGLIHRSRGDNPLAWANVEKTLDINPSNDTALKLLGSWAIEDNRVEDVLPRFEKYLDINQQEIELHQAYIILLIHCQRLAQARMEFERLQLFAPDRLENPQIQKMLDEGRVLS